MEGGEGWRVGGVNGAGEARNTSNYGITVPTEALALYPITSQWSFLVESWFYLNKYVLVGFWECSFKMNLQIVKLCLANHYKFTTSIIYCVL